MSIVDLTFTLQGSSIPVDHGYALYAALSRLIPGIHGANEIGVQPIRGVYGGDGVLHITSSSCLVLRLPDDQLRPYLKLAGKRIDVDGHFLRLGLSRARVLCPAVTLYARLVTIKGFIEPEAFLAAAYRQLRAMTIMGDLHIGARRTLRVKDKQVVGFEVMADRLTAEGAIKLQEAGIGGRRRFACGVFVPFGEKI